MHPRSSRLRTVIAAFALLACAPQSSRAEPAADDASPATAERPVGKTDFEWSGELAAGGRVEIGNVNGDIRVRPSVGVDDSSPRTLAMASHDPVPSLSSLASKIR